MTTFRLPSSAIEPNPHFNIGRFAHAPQQMDLVNRDGEYLGWTTEDGVQMLTGRKQIQVPDWLQ